MFVLDSSADIALLNREESAPFIADRLPDAVISAVNLQEIVKKMLDAGYADPDIREAVGALDARIASHDSEAADLAASLATVTRKFGKGLSDRSCMALAIRLGAPALTTDHTWAKIDILGLSVLLAR